MNGSTCREQDKTPILHNRQARITWYCNKCFPDGKGADGKPVYGICNPTVRSSCFAKHVLGIPPTHTARVGIAKAPTRVMTRESPGRARAAPRVPRDERQPESGPLPRRRI